ncbi:hypothetical protein B0H13DRAFT_2298661, partial [Mycena leptocephala]
MENLLRAKVERNSDPTKTSADAQHGFQPVLSREHDLGFGWKNLGLAAAVSVELNQFKFLAVTIGSYLPEFEERGKQMQFPKEDSLSSAWLLPDNRGCSNLRHLVAVKPGVGAIALISVKRNKDECIGFMENVHRVLCAIVNLHVRSETAGSLSPSILDHIGSFKETLHKIYTFIDAQQDGNKIKQFLRQSEMNVLLRNCRAGLDHAIAAFDIETGVTIYNSISEMKKYTEKIHEELLELVSTLSDSDGTFSDRSSSIYHEGNGSQNRSSMVANLNWLNYEYSLPGVTQDSHSRRRWNGQNQPRQIPHHPDICTKYKHRFLPVVNYFPEASSLLIWIIWKPLEPYVLIMSTFATHIPDHNSRQFPQPEEMNQLLRFTDNMPLAVDLMAHLVDYEGFQMSWHVGN